MRILIREISLALTLVQPGFSSATNLRTIGDWVAAQPSVLRLALCTILQQSANQQKFPQTPLTRP
jgi:hypothetical protein